MRHVLAWSLAYFLIAMTIAVIAFGWDLDRLRSRSPVSRVAASVHDVLWLPHDAALRAIPSAWLIRNRYVIPAALAVNSLVWGSTLFATWHLLVRSRRTRDDGAPPL